ncbi:phage tail protein [Alteromonadaceae bacterium M269]|nr:phage tail protein [Alteromonadaceae bacterium M269]
MPRIDQFTHNGVSIERTVAPPPRGPLGRTVFGLVGTAPDADPSLPRNTPILMFNMGDAAKLDTTGNESGTLWRTVFEIFRVVSVPIYVVIVDEGATPADTVNSIIGGAQPGTGRLTGIAALAQCREAPTHICAPGFNTKPVADALVALGARIYAIPVGDGPGTNDEDAKDYSELLGGPDTGYENYYLVEPQVLVYSQAVKGNVPFSAAAMALTSFARVSPWESPASQGGALIQGVTRTIDYNILDKSTQGSELNRYGVSYYASTSLGGFSLIGNRTVTGRFINYVGLEYQIIRRLANTAQRLMGQNLTRSLMEQEIRALNVWLQSQSANDVLIGAEVYLHPALNNEPNYSNGEWHIAIRHAGYPPNEHMVYHIIEDQGIRQAFIEEIR